MTHPWGGVVPAPRKLSRSRPRDKPTRPGTDLPGRYRIRQLPAVPTAAAALRLVHSGSAHGRPDIGGIGRQGAGPPRDRRGCRGARHRADGRRHWWRRWPLAGHGWLAAADSGLHRQRECRAGDRQVFARHDRRRTATGHCGHCLQHRRRFRRRDLRGRQHRHQQPRRRRAPAATACARLRGHLPRGRLRPARRTLAALYRDEIDATGQPMSPEPFAAIQNAVEHYRVDDILVSTFAGRAVEVARGGADRPGRARSPTSRSSTSSPAATTAAGGVAEPVGAERARGGGALMESASIAVGGAHAHEHHGPPEAQRLLEDRPPDARDPALHRLRGDALRGLLRLVLLPPRGLEPAASGRPRASSCRSSSPASTRRSWSRPRSRSTGRSRAPARATATR